MTKPEFCKKKKCPFYELPFNEFPCTTCEVYSWAIRELPIPKNMLTLVEQRERQNERNVNTMNINEAKDILRVLKTESDTFEPKEFFELEDLYGIHKLSGVDILEGNDEDEGRKCLFILDDEKYCGSENPDDGYRSYMGCVYSLMNDMPIKNTFPDEDVICCGYEGWADGEQYSSGIQFLNLHTGEPILILGTVALDEYYPCCRMEYNPEKMYANLRK